MRFIQNHCNIIDCKNKHHAKGFCGSHYASYRKSKGIYKQNNKLSLGNFDFEYKDRTNWSLSVKKIFLDKCMICGWQDAPCDVHHIIPRSKNGKNCIKNAIVLCPNHHKLADIGKIEQNYLQKITNNKLEESICRFGLQDL